MSMRTSTTPPLRTLLMLAVLLPAFLHGPPPAAAESAGDLRFREGWTLLSEEKHPEALARFRMIDAGEHDLGDYVLYFSGVCLAAEGKREEAAALRGAIEKRFPSSPLPAYLSHELALAAVKDGDLASAREYHAASRGKVSGAARKAEEGYVAARLLEEERAEGSAAEPPPPVSAPRPPVALKAAEAHLENFTAHGVHDGAILSMERLWAWRGEGRLPGELTVAFHGRFARALARADETDKAVAVYREALARVSPADPRDGGSSRGGGGDPLGDYYTVLLDFAELLRKQGDTDESRKLLARSVDGAPRSFRSEVDFLSARVEWKAGRHAEARRKFLEIADGEVRPATAERARYLAAWIAEEEEDVAAAAEEFGKLRSARDETIRQESAFRHAFGLYRLKRYPEALAAFEAGEKSGFSSVERARHSFWKARALRETGEKAKGDDLLASLSADPGAGLFAMFAARIRGKDPFEILNAPSSGETNACAQEKERLRETVRSAGWGEADAEKVRRADRLISLGVLEYAVLEAERVDRAAVRKALGLADGGAPGLFRYLAGDLKGAIRETSGLAVDPSTVGLVDRLQFPLAPEYVGDCDRKKSGLDPLVLHSIIRQESQFQHNALSPAGAVGLMQLMPRTAAEIARKEKGRKVRRRDLLKPSLNVDLGAAYLGRLVRGYGGDYVRAVAAYNAGEAAVARWWQGSGGDPALFLERMSYRETRFYLRRVFFNLLQYYRIYRPAMLARYFPTPRPAGPPAPDASGSPPGEDLPAPPGSGPGSPADATGGG